jgi:hypothetical protein
MNVGATPSLERELIYIVMMFMVTFKAWWCFFKKKLDFTMLEI